MRILGFGEGLIQKFEKRLLDHPSNGDQYFKWNMTTHHFDSSTFDPDSLDTTLTRRSLDSLLDEVRSGLIFQKFMNFEYNESKRFLN